VETWKERAIEENRENVSCSQQLDFRFFCVAVPILLCNLCTLSVTLHVVKSIVCAKSVQFPNHIMFGSVFIL
jgi:hypothetical protein